MFLIPFKHFLAWRNCKLDQIYAIGQKSGNTRQDATHNFALEKLIEAVLLLCTLSQDHEVWLEANLFLSLSLDSPGLSFSINSVFRSSPFLHEIGY